MPHRKIGEPHSVDVEHRIPKDKKRLHAPFCHRRKCAIEFVRLSGV
jgi:hypothetical protein